MDGGDADGRGVERACGCEGGFDSAECRDAEFLPGFLGDVGVAVDDGGELYGLAALFKFAIDAKMVATEGSGSDDGDAEWLGGGHYFLSTGASTAWRQRA